MNNVRLYFFLGYRITYSYLNRKIVHIFYNPYIALLYNVYIYFLKNILYDLNY